MKQKLLSRLVTGLLLTGMIGMANAAFIVDTGSTGPSLTGTSLDSGQWIAGGFSVAGNTTITDLEGYMWGQGQVSSLTGVIYSGGGAIPGSELYSSQFSVNGSADDWYGAHNLNWSLTAGTYWAAFEVRTGDTYNGAMPNSAINPLGIDAFWDGVAWNPDGGLGFGMRITASPTANPVPIPATAWLLGSGLLSLIGVARRKTA